MACFGAFALQAQLAIFKLPSNFNLLKASNVGLKLAINVATESLILDVPTQGITGSSGMCGFIIPWVQL